MDFCQSIQDGHDHVASLVLKTHINLSKNHYITLCYTQIYTKIQMNAIQSINKNIDPKNQFYTIKTRLATNFV